MPRPRRRRSTVDGSVSPTKAGTKSKPKSEKLKLSVSTTTRRARRPRPRSRSPAEHAEGHAPRASTSARRPTTTSSPRRRLQEVDRRQGLAHALVNPFADPPAQLDVQGRRRSSARTRSSSTSTSADRQAVLHGKISRPEADDRDPARRCSSRPRASTRRSLDLDDRARQAKGKNALIASVGCKSKKHAIASASTTSRTRTRRRRRSASGTGRREVLVVAHASRI